MEAAILFFFNCGKNIKDGLSSHWHSETPGQMLIVLFEVLRLQLKVIFC